MATNKDYLFKRLYRNLYNAEFYYQAYQKIYSKEGNMTSGTDNKTIDGISIERIGKLITEIKDFSYQPRPARRIYIPKKNGTKRPLGIPSIDDKLVQEVIRTLLESIYEPKFSECSHGFRPNRSCHTALVQCKKRFNGVRWFIEGDIKGFFDNIDHHILINILRKTIKDEAFISLIWKFLKSGYIEGWSYHNTYSGAPQGGIISPILSNIYLHQLDEYIVEYSDNFNIGTKRKENTEYRKYKKREITFRNKYKDKWEEILPPEKEKLKKKFKEICKLKYTVPYSDPMDSNFRRMQYVRYADDFIIGLIGSKSDAMMVKEELTKFLTTKLNLELSQEKTLVTHSSNKAKFLGYEITVSRQQQRKKRADGAISRTVSSKCFLYVPTDAWVNKLKSLEALNIKKDGSWMPKHRSYLKDYDDLEIVSIYNAEIRGMYNYYKLANNASVLNKFYYVMKYSMFKTYGAKYQISIAKVCNKFRTNGKFGIRYQTKNGDKIRYFYDEGFKRVNTSAIENNSTIDKIVTALSFKVGESLMKRLKSLKCEWCNAENIKLEMHHIKKLKDLKGRKKWEQFMIARKRKTIALCVKCHDLLHAGKLD